MPNVPFDRAVAALAERQHGLVARRQLAELGLGEGAIDRRVATGRLHVVMRGVYAVGHGLTGPRGRPMAAALACGDGAVVSHRSAAELWSLLPPSEGRTDVTVASRRRGRARMRVHRSRLHPEDRAKRYGIPVTSVARTLLDLAAVARADQLERAFEEADRLRLLDVRALRRTLGRNPGRRGAAAIRALLGRQADVPDTRSELERRFLAFCRRARLPQPMTNALIEGFEVDAVWSRERLVVELDGWAYHRTRRAFERDRARDTALQVAGFRVLRVTQQRLVEEPAKVARAIARLLASAGAGYQR